MKISKISLTQIILSGISFLFLLLFFIPNFLISKFKIFNIVVGSCLLLLGISLFVLEYLRRKL